MNQRLRRQRAVAIYHFEDGKNYIKGEYKMAAEKLASLRGNLAMISLELSNLKSHYQKYSDKLDSPTWSEIIDNFNRLDRTLKRATDSIERLKAELKEEKAG